MMQDYELDAWLGDFAGETTPEQKDRLRQAAATIDTRWPDEDDADSREQALNAAAQIILGDDTLEAYGARVMEAQRQVGEARAGLTGALIATDAPETVLAQRSGVSRMTVRKALGK